MFQEYSYTCTDRSKLPKVLKAWGALEQPLKALSPALIKKYLGAPCMITIEYSKPNAITQWHWCMKCHKSTRTGDLNMDEVKPK